MNVQYLIRSGAACLLVSFLSMASPDGAARGEGAERAGVIADETRELRGILDELERQLGEIRNALADDKADIRAQAVALDEATRLIAFLEQEAAAALRSDKSLQERLDGLKSQADELQRELQTRFGTDASRAEERSARRLALGGKRGSVMRQMAPAAMAAPSAANMKAVPAMGMMFESDAIWMPPPPPPAPGEDWNREAYAHLDENPFIPVADDPLSTFSIDVDTASYSNLRRLLKEGKREIPKGAIRIEELVNYFRYQYRPPGDDHPLVADVEVTGCPWTPEHRLVRVALQARQISMDARKPSNLVFLLDTSGSMRSDDKIGLLKEAYKLLIDNLDDRDTVAIVAYAGSAGLVLPPTTANNRLTLRFAVEKLQAGGSTAGGEGIKLAYQTARDHFLKDGNNRVILATDGDFNVGVSSESELVELIKEEAKSGVFLTVLGFGTGNYQDARMEALSNHGNGNYAYIDGMAEARKVFLTDLTGTLYTIAKDVKFQIEVNPAYVASYRLIGYENRQLADRDFKDDKKDAGEVGSGHQVTALYELVPAGAGVGEGGGTDLRYQSTREVVDSDELMQIKVRYKQPDGDASTEFSEVVAAPEGWRGGLDFSSASADTRFAASVAAFGMVLRGSEHSGKADFDWVYRTATKSLGQDSGGFRSEFTELVRQARELKAAPEAPKAAPDPGLRD